MKLWKEWWFQAAVFGALSLAADYFNSRLTALFFLFAFGTVILLKGADMMVENASAFANYYGISSMVIGLTIVAFGTSVPELTVSVVSALKNITDISIGNIVGSNIANIGLILGLAASFRAIAIRKTSLKFDTPFMVFSGFMLLLLAFNIGFDFTAYWYSLGHIDGIILLALFSWFMAAVIKRGISQSREANKEGARTRQGNPMIFLLFTSAGTAGVIIGGNLLVDSAADIARLMGFSEVVIGLTIVAIGTSLPELVTSIVAAIKKETDIAVGNIIGSNIFNTLWVLGLVGAIRPLEIKASVLLIDIPIMILFSIIFWLFARNDYRLHRKEGAALVLLYAGYIALVLFRQMGFQLF